MGAGKGEKRKKGRESARKPGKTNAVRRKRGESHDFSAIALADAPSAVGNMVKSGNPGESTRGALGKTPQRGRQCGEKRTHPGPDPDPEAGW